VHVPKEISADRVQAHRLRHAQSMLPIFARHTGRVHFATTNLKSLTVQEEIVVADCERVVRRHTGCRKASRAEYEQSKGRGERGEKSIRFHKSAFGVHNAKMFTAESNAGNSKAADG